MVSIPATVDQFCSPGHRAMTICSSSTTSYTTTFSSSCRILSSQQVLGRKFPGPHIRGGPIGKMFRFEKKLSTCRTKLPSESDSKGNGFSLVEDPESLTRRALQARPESASDAQDRCRKTRPHFLLGGGLGSTLGFVICNAEACKASTLTSPSVVPRDVWLSFVLFLGDLDPGTAQLAITFAGPLITLFNLLLIFRIVMSWYPGIPVKKFPFFLAYNPTEPVLGPTRKLIPPVGGVDVSPVIWVAVMSFANEILLGKQGLLVLLSQQQP